MGMVYILMRMVVTWVYTFVKPHWTAHLNSVRSLECCLYLNSKYFKICPKEWTGLIEKSLIEGPHTELWAGLREPIRYGGSFGTVNSRKPSQLWGLKVGGDVEVLPKLSKSHGHERGCLKGMLAIHRVTRSLPLIWYEGSGEEIPHHVSPSTLQIPRYASYGRTHLVAAGQRSTGTRVLTGHPLMVQSWAEKGRRWSWRDSWKQPHSPSILFFHLDEENSKQNGKHKVLSVSVCPLNRILTWS